MHTHILIMCKYIYIYAIYVLHITASHVCLWLEGWHRLSGFQDLQLQMIMSHHVDFQEPNTGSLKDD